MQLEPHLAQVADQLAAAAALGDERTQHIAAALTTAASPAVRLALLHAVSEAAEELTAQLVEFPGRPAVSTRLDGDELTVEVSATEALTADEAPHAEGEPTARISLRLTDALKAEIDSAAERDGVSVNTWLVRAAASAVRANSFGGRQAGRPNSRVTGWING